MAKKRMRQPKDKSMKPSGTRPAGRPKATKDTPLTPRQTLFVREYVGQYPLITKTEAARRAGYSPNSCSRRGYELTHPELNPHVVAAIQAYQAELDRKYAVDYKRHVKDLQIIRDKALEAGSYSAAVAAETRRGMAEGNIYISKSEIRHGTIDQMSKEEVLKALEELKRENEFIEISPERITEEEPEVPEEEE